MNGNADSTRPDRQGHRLATKAAALGLVVSDVDQVKVKRPAFLRARPLQSPRQRVKAVCRRIQRHHLSLLAESFIEKVPTTIMACLYLPITKEPQFRIVFLDASPLELTLRYGVLSPIVRVCLA
jgi:hypothetical protein